jgi:hypothetical protein
VTGTNPANGTTGVATNTAITITFDRSADFDSSAFTIDCGAAQVFNTDGFGTDTAILTPSASLPTSAICTVTVDANICLDCGMWMTADYVFTFSTAAVATDNAPTVTNTSPMDTFTIATVDDNIIVTFTEPVNVDEVTFQSFTIDCGTGPLAHAVSGTTTAAITLDPAASLPSGATCTVTVVAANVTDVDVIDPPDTMTANYVFSFTTP